MPHTRLPKPCRLCGLIGPFETIDVSGEGCGIRGSKPCTPCVQLKQLDDKIKETANLLQRLLGQRHDLKSKRNHHHDQLIKRIPLEILSRIFAFCHPYFPIRASSAFKSFRGLRIEPSESGITPWMLGLVCKSWRDIVWSTPQLWTSVSLDTTPGSKKGYMKFAQEWLLRSGGLPLSLTLYEDGYHPYTAEEATVDRTLFKAINKSSPRWRCLNVCVSDSQLPYLSGDSSGTWILQDLHLERASRSEDATAKPLIFGTHAKPTPRRVSVHEASFSNVGIKWDHVTHLDVSWYAAADYLETFRHAHQMTHVTLRPANREDLQTMPPSEMIVHKHLQVLHIPLSWSDDSFGSLLDNLTLPSLQELHAHGYLSEVTALITRSKCRITRLDMSIADPEDQLIALLERLSFLTDLTRSLASISNAFFEKLGPIIDASGQNFDAGNVKEFLPKLCSLEIECPLSFQWKCLADMFASPPGAIEPPRRALRSFEMRVDNEDDSRLPEGVVQRLLAVSEGGVHMWITNGCGFDMLCNSSDSD